MYKPLISIVMSTYNNSFYLREAIDSVLKQSFKNWEFIIINDASTDNTHGIIKEYEKKDKRFIYIKNKKNKGQTKNLNKGIDLAKGDFIARLDGDDIWIDKDKLKEQVNFLKLNKDYAVVGSYWININSKGEKISQITYPTDDKNIRNYLLIENCFLHSSIMIRKNILDKVGRYNTQYKYAQDYDLWLRIGKVSKLYNIPKFMVKYRINPYGLTQTYYKKQLQNTYKIIKNYQRDYPHFGKSYILWQLRLYLPDQIKKYLSRRIQKLFSC